MTIRTTTTVTDAASSYDLVTLANLKADLSVTDTSEDVFLKRAISITSSKISQYCNRVFSVEGLVDIIDQDKDNFPFQYPSSIRALQTSRFPIVDITSVTEGAGATAVALVEGTDFRADYTNGTLYRLDANGNVRNWFATPVTVTYEAGFDTVPLDLQGALTEVVKSVRFNRARDPLLKSENILSGLYAYTLFDPSQASGGQASIAAEVLSNYRVPVVG